MLPPLCLYRRDPDRNMARFYRLALVPTLFGETAVMRSWGRIGTVGQSRADTYALAEDALAAFTKLAAGKQRRGYGK